MLFTSLKFIVFAGVSITLFYAMPARGQRVWLLLVNYVFYMWWEPGFGALLLATTCLTFLDAHAIAHRVLGARRLWLTVGVIYVLGQLALWKYADFFLRGFAAIFHFGGNVSLGLLLPIGISFYSFSAIGYLVDVYRGKLEAEPDFLNYALFLSFFPAILSGPIPRARELLPQFRYRHIPDGSRMRAGLLRFTWGAAKKLVPTELLATLVNTAYAAPANFTGGQWLAAVIAFSLYIYLDFSSYTDMSVGVARMLGFTLPENFNAPYLARSVRDFWRRWHISLTSWFREYLFLPLGGSRVSQWRTCLNILIVFALSGLWHGANVTFILWGGLNGLYQVAERLFFKQKVREKEHPLMAAVRTILVFGLITLSWIFFRADSLGQAVFIIKRILLVFQYGLGTQPLTELGLTENALRLLPLFLLPVLWEDWRKDCGRPLPHVQDRPYVYCLLLMFLALVIAVFGQYGEAFDPSEFVYFHF